MCLLHHLFVRSDANERLSLCDSGNTADCETWQCCLQFFPLSVSLFCIFLPFVVIMSFAKVVNACFVLQHSAHPTCLSQSLILQKQLFTSNESKSVSGHVTCILVNVSAVTCIFFSSSLNLFQLLHGQFPPKTLHPALRQSSTSVLSWTNSRIWMNVWNQCILQAAVEQPGFGWGKTGVRHFHSSSQAWGSSCCVQKAIWFDLIWLNLDDELGLPFAWESLKPVSSRKGDSPLEINSELLRQALWAHATKTQMCETL